MKYRQSFLSGLVIFLLSLFSQWLNWFAFEKLSYSSKYLFITPMILCLMYHLVQLDAGKDECFSRRFFFTFSVMIPFIFGLIMTVVMFLLNPGLSTFTPDADYAGTVPEIISTYVGRFMVTSLYMAVFALIDIPILKLIDRKRAEK